MNILSGEPTRAFKDYLSADEEHRAAGKRWQSNHARKTYTSEDSTTAFVVSAFMTVGFLLVALIVGVPVLAFLSFTPFVIAVGAIFLHPGMPFRSRKRNRAVSSDLMGKRNKRLAATNRFLDAVELAIVAREDLTLSTQGDDMTRVVVTKHNGDGETDDYFLRSIQGVPCLLNDRQELLKSDYSTTDKTTIKDDQGNVTVLDKSVLEAILATDQ